MIQRFRQQIAAPYSLHDAVVTNITCQNNALRLSFRDGYTAAEDPDTLLMGQVTLEGVDMESSYALRLSPCGSCGSFAGEKLPLQDFITRHAGCTFEIIEEWYGFQQVAYLGYLHPANEDALPQMLLSICFDGDILYETEEA